jgi:hypothetical protein
VNFGVAATGVMDGVGGFAEPARPHAKHTTRDTRVAALRYLVDPSIVGKPNDDVLFMKWFPLRDGYQTRRIASVLVFKGGFSGLSPTFGLANLN